MSWKFFFPMFLGVLFCLLPAGVCADERVPRLEGMSVEYVETPLAVDVSCPRFGWRMVGDSTVRGLRQVAYQLEVTDEYGTLVWNSGRVKDSRSQNIEYKGEALKPLTRYDWRVTVWDHKGRRLQQTSCFETSLLTTDGVEGWGGARWIGGGDDDRMLYSPYLPVFKLNLAFRLCEGAASRKLAFVYGANDRRLMDANMNLEHLENGRDSSYIKVEFDLAPLDFGRAARLNVYRAGYVAADRADVPLCSFEIPLAVLDKSRMHALQCLPSIPIWVLPVSIRTIHFWARKISIRWGGVVTSSLFRWWAMSGSALAVRQTWRKQTSKSATTAVPRTVWLW